MQTPAKIPFTQEAYDDLKREQHRLLKLREEVTERLKVAREMGDLSENGAYRYAKQELGSIARQLRDIRYKLIFGYVATKKPTNGTIDFGSTVTIQNALRTMTFLLVSEHESDPSKNKLSTQSPIGAAVIGKKVGDEVTVQLPGGTATYTIIQVD